MLVSSKEVLDFWKQAGPAKWFAKDVDFDREFKSRFEDTHFAAAANELDDWLSEAESSLALILLLDQFPRNCFRNTGHMFATDPLCRFYADKAIEKNFDQQVDKDLAVFFYLPLMHSEDLKDQERCLQLCKPLGETSYHHAVVHYDIIKKFGRFPHRNPQLGRKTTPEEQKFLTDGGFAG